LTANKFVTVEAGMASKYNAAQIELLKKYLVTVAE
jgi:hypothetical protein